ncbi:MAG: purine-nucleoside phosphorylase [Desulfatitalea sp.]|nr:purine-nucleoside phosphorylase [Desulfatitalea sp.]NNK00602.1 purine-nucleoside phosphorylase [Desulfatitalea sp.]
MADCVFKGAIEAADFIHAQLGHDARTAIMTGTGLGDMADALEDPVGLDYDQIPHFPAATVQSHLGRLVSGHLQGFPVLVLQGRFHLYEGYTPLAVTFPIRVLQALGVRNLVLTNASGGLNPGFAVGDTMVIADHINLTGENPLVGSNEAGWGERFPDMTAAYDPHLRDIVSTAAGRLDLPFRQGVYAGLKGPSLETPAEMRFLQTIGADAVGFSTVMETIAAVHGGMRVLGLSTITNMCRPNVPAPASVEEIITVARAAAPRLAVLLGAVSNEISSLPMTGGTA